MMARMLTQVPLPLLPRDAAEIAPGVGMVAGPDGGGVVWVHGLATFAWDAGDEAGRRLAAVQLCTLTAEIESPTQRAESAIRNSEGQPSDRAQRLRLVRGQRAGSA